MKDVMKGESISFAYQNMTSNTLSNISFQIKEGECVVLCGKSGSGKTTLIRLLNGLCPNFYSGDLSGACESFDLKAGEHAIEDYVAHVGSVFQNPKTQYFNVNTTAELAFPCENMGYEREQIVARLDEVVKKCGISNLMDRSIFKLSGGEKQRIAFASATMLKPKLLVLDEPTSNLDQTAIEDMKELIQKEKESGTTIVIAEHRLEWTKEFADRYFFFEEGKLSQIWERGAFENLSEKTLDNMGLRQFSLERIKAVVEEKKTQMSDIKELPVLTTQNLVVGYGKKEVVVQVPDFSICRGEIVAVMGHNGVGKSTFVKTICGLLKPLGGAVHWNKKQAKRKELLKNSFMVMQDVNYQLFSDSVREEVLLGVDIEEQVEEHCHAVLSELGLLAYAEQHPMSLSGGQKQRVAIASAMVADKDLIIMDEPTSGLDGYHMKQVGKLLERLKEQGKAVIVVTHDEELVAHCCDRVFCL